jgi:SAM-dependent methyltransferase
MRPSARLSDKTYSFSLICHFGRRSSEHDLPGCQTLMRLDALERERDLWQRPADFIRVLNVGNGDVVADLGCGSGYFGLKLSPIVGGRAHVLAVDIRRISLFFLWVRAILRHDLNISIVHARQDDPHLATGAVDAVLIATRITS